MSFKLTIAILIVSTILINEISAKSRFVRAANSTGGSNFNTSTAVAYYDETIESSGVEGSGIEISGDEGSGLSFINFADEGSQNDTEPLLFDTSNEATQSVVNQSINITDSDADTLVIKVHLPSRSVDSLLNSLEDDANTETDLDTNLDMAVSITGILNSLLGRIQGSSQ